MPLLQPNTMTNKKRVSNHSIKKISAGQLLKAAFSQAGAKGGPDQLGPPVRFRSTQIVLDHEKKNVNLNEIETFTHFKVKIPVKNGPNYERIATFLRVVLFRQAAILYSSCQFLSDLSRVYPSLIPPRRDPDEGKSFSVNLHLSTKLKLSVITHFCYTAWFRRNSLYFCLAPYLENRKLIDLANL